MLRHFREQRSHRCGAAFGDKHSILNLTSCKASARSTPALSRSTVCGRSLREPDFTQNGQVTSPSLLKGNSRFLLLYTLRPLPLSSCDRPSLDRDVFTGGHTLLCSRPAHRLLLPIWTTTIVSKLERSDSRAARFVSTRRCIKQLLTKISESTKRCSCILDYLPPS